MSEKAKTPSRLLFYLITLSLFLLILSSLSLRQFGDVSLLPGSVFGLILVNETSIYLDSAVQRSSNDIAPFLPPLASITQSSNFGPTSEERACSTSGIGTLTCDSNNAVLKVYMYDLPPEFHFGLLGWKGAANQTWPAVDDPMHIPSYPGGLTLQHSMEYWLTLDLLASNVPSVVRSCSAVRVYNSSEADIIFVPFFSSLSYNRHSKPLGRQKTVLNKILQDKLVQYLMDQDLWKRYGGKDHLIVAHHPNSMAYSRKKLASAMFVLADFGRYPEKVANIRKDVIAPYKHVVRSTPNAKSAQFDQRPTLAYFKGAIYRKDGGATRQELFYLLKDEKDVDFTFGSYVKNGVKRAAEGMAASKFCLHIAGDTPSSNRLFDIIATHCVPVIISDAIELPFEDVLDYSEFSVFVHASDAVKPGYLLNLLRGIKRDVWTEMWLKLQEINLHFEYHYPSRPGDAVDMIWNAVSRKVDSIRLQVNRKNRYHRAYQNQIETDS
ncbi:Probable arabinosyltransferase ARAD1 [Linum grandiflorum]